MKVLAGDFPKNAQAWALHDRFIFGDKRRGEPVLYTDIENISLDEETKKGCIVNILLLDGRRLLALMSLEEYMQARASEFDAGGEVEDRRQEAIARTKRVRQQMAAQASQEKRIKQGIAAAVVVVIAYLMFKSSDEQATSSANEVALEAVPIKQHSTDQPAPKRGVAIADDAFMSMDKANFPKAYKKWGAAGFEKINDLGPKAAQLIAASETCDALNVLALSDERSKPKSDIVFFGDCANGKRFYVSEKDIESGTKAVSVNDLMSSREDGDYIQTCFDHTASSLKFPSSFDPSWLSATVYHAPTGGVVVQAPFEAKNGVGNTLPFNTRCVFDDQGMSPPEISNR